MKKENLFFTIMTASFLMLCGAMLIHSEVMGIIAGGLILVSMLGNVVTNTVKSKTSAS